MNLFTLHHSTEKDEAGDFKVKGFTIEQSCPVVIFLEGKRRDELGVRSEIDPAICCRLALQPGDYTLRIPDGYRYKDVVSSIILDGSEFGIDILMQAAKIFEKVNGCPDVVTGSCVVTEGIRCGGEMFVNHIQHGPMVCTPFFETIEVDVMNKTIEISLGS